MILFAVIFKFLYVKALISVNGDTSACPAAIIDCFRILLHEFLKWHASWNFDALDIFATIASWVWSIIINVCENCQWAHGSSWPESTWTWIETIFDGSDFFFHAKLDLIFRTPITTDFISVNSNSINDPTRIDDDCWWFWMFGTI